MACVWECVFGCERVLACPVQICLCVRCPCVRCLCVRCPCVRCLCVRCPCVRCLCVRDVLPHLFLSLSLSFSLALSPSRSRALSLSRSLALALSRSLALSLSRSLALSLNKGTGIPRKVYRDTKKGLRAERRTKPSAYAVASLTAPVSHHHMSVSR